MPIRTSTAVLAQGASATQCELPPIRGCRTPTQLVEKGRAALIPCGVADLGVAWVSVREDTGITIRSLEDGNERVHPRSDRSPRGRSPRAPSRVHRGASTARFPGSDG